MSDFEVELEVIRVDNQNTKCQKEGDKFIIGKRTPPGMCCRAFHTVFSNIVALRFSNQCAWEKNGAWDVICPDGFVTYRLKRIVKQTNA